MNQILQDNPKKLYDEKGAWWKTLHLHGIPLKKLFKTIRPIEDLLKCRETKTEKEIFLSIDAKQNFYFYVEPTPEFKRWADANTMVKPYSFEIIQQKYVETPQSKPVYLDSFLVLIEETQIIGSVWLDYKTKMEIEQFFNVKIPA